MLKKLLYLVAKKKYQENFNKLDVFHTVRIIGGLFEQFCSKYPCVEENKLWESRVVAIAVNNNDRKYRDVYTLSDLKKIINWKEVKAFLENGQGVNLRYSYNFSNEREKKQTEVEPAFRIVREHFPEIALANIKKRGIYYSTKQLQIMRKGCHRLYDHLWSSLTDLRTKKDRGSKSFSRFFNKFYEKYGERFRTCSRYVRFSNINHNHNKHWQMSMFSGFFKLEDLNYIYICDAHTWRENRIGSNGLRRFSPLKEYKKCTDRQLDKSFKLISFFMNEQYNRFDRYYKYISYDNGIGGSHQKIYSWVLSKGRPLACQDSLDFSISNRKNSEVFPESVRWKSYNIRKKKNKAVN